MHLTLLQRTLLIAVGTTLGVAVLSFLIPEEYAATGVGLGFCAATYWTVLRYDAEVIQRHGLALGGLLLPEPLQPRVLLRSFIGAMKWCALSAGVWFPLFVIGYLYFWQPRTEFHFRPGADPFNEFLAQVLAIALSEELFYRGFLQSRLDQVWKP